MIRRVLSYSMIILLHSTGLRSATNGSLTLTQLKNTDYTIAEWGVPRQVIKLNNGEYLHPKHELDLHLGKQIAFGDLDGDGAQDAVVVMWLGTGGNGAMVSLAAVLNQNGEPRHVATIELEDRAEIVSLTIQTGLIRAELKRHGPNDGLCCPSMKVVEYYRLENRTLIKYSAPALLSSRNGSPELSNLKFSPGEEEALRTWVDCLKQLGLTNQEIEYRQKRLFVGPGLSIYNYSHHIGLVLLLDLDKVFQNEISWWRQSPISREHAFKRKRATIEKASNHIKKACHLPKPAHKG